MYTICNITQEPQKLQPPLPLLNVYCCFFSPQYMYHLDTRKSLRKSTQTSKQKYPDKVRLPCNTFKDKITSANMSSYDILNQPRLGQFLRIRIQAVSETNCPQREGGDFWFAVLKALNTTGSTSSPVVDHENGTYSVDLLVGWSGYVVVDIILVHPSVATQILDRVTNISDYSRLFWNAKFRSEKQIRKGNKVLIQKQVTTSVCSMMYHGPKSWENKCAYINERALGTNTARVCEKPTNGLTCDNIVSFTTNVALIAKVFNNMSSALGKDWLFKGYVKSFLTSC